MGRYRFIDDCQVQHVTFHEKGTVGGVKGPTSVTICHRFGRPLFFTSAHAPKRHAPKNKSQLLMGQQ